MSRAVVLSRCCYGVLVAIAASVLPSCQNVLGIEDTTLAAPVDAAVTAPAEWYCTGTKQPVATPGNITVNILTTEFTGVANPPVPDVHIRVCALVDTQCDSGIDLTTTDAQGRGSNQVPIDAAGFVYYIEATADGFTPLIWLFSRPPVASFDLEIKMVREAVLANMIPGLVIDPTKGHLTSTVKPCDNQSPEGVVVDVTPRNAESTRYYVSGQNFVLDSVQDSTGPDGHSAVFNLAPGSVIATVRPASKPAFTICQTSGVIRAGFITTVDLYPQ